VIRGFAIGGKAGAGKNALADSLSSALLELGHWPTQLAFGDVLKAEVWSRFRLKKDDPGGRQRLIEWGDHRRAQHPDYFVKALSKIITASTPYSMLPIITDVRRHNEFDYCRDAGFYMVRVEAPRTMRMWALEGRGEDVSLVDVVHPTECELDWLSMWDYVVLNDHGVALYPLAARIVDAAGFREAA
jgi:phosphomevalonate kinase